ncbi:MAG TPA: hypothetical protein VID95_14410 [Candidatus Limnocylindrales bacterium]
MSAGGSRRLATALAIWALAMTAGALVLMVPNSSGTSLEDLGFNGVGGLMLGTIYPILGWLIATRRPENRIGWMFLVIGLSQAASGFVSEYAIYGLITRPGALPIAEIAAWIGTWAWVPGFVLLFVTILLFPDGRLPSRRWRPVLWLAWVAAVLTLLPTAVAAWGYRGVNLLSNVEPDPGNDVLMTIYLATSALGQVLIVLVGLAAVGAVATRYRHTNSVERQQIKWLTVAAVVEVGFLVLMNFVTLPFPVDIISAILITPLVPISIGIAILRYRLYEIDRIVSRTIAYAILTGILGATFVVTIIAIQAMLASITESQTIAVAASTLVAFALFQPLRRRVQNVVDRHFHRAAIDAERTTTAYAARLRVEMSLEAVGAGLRETVDVALRPRSTGVWLRGRDQ